jgi:hypothetical protein
VNYRMLKKKFRRTFEKLGKFSEQVPGSINKLAKTKNVDPTLKRVVSFNCTPAQAKERRESISRPESRFTSKLAFPILWRLPPTQGCHPLPPIYVSRKQALASVVLPMELVRHTTQPHKSK